MPTSRQIAAEIRARIDSGALRPGAKAPSARAITKKWGVAIATASKALAILQEEGVVRSIPGSGTIVEAGLSKAKIVAAALRLADEEGLAAVSMRRIALELGVATMSIYRHVADKGALLLLVADAAYGEEPPPSKRERRWRPRLELAARLQWKVYRKHPWLAGGVSITRPQLVPQGMAHTEWILEALEGLGLDDEMMLVVALTIIGYVRGLATSLEMEAEAQQESGVDPDAFIAAQEAEFKTLVAGGAYPTLVRVSAKDDMDLGLDRLFEFGLARLLDGLESFLPRR